MSFKQENNKNKLKLLLVSFSFFPDDSPNTYRWKNIIDIWAAKGIEVFVVSAQKPGFRKFEIVNGIKIYRTGRSLFQRVKTKLGSISNENLVIRENDKSLNKESLFRKTYNFLWKRFCWPDWAFLSYYPTLKLSREIIKRENITNLITVSWPFTDHLVGYKLKKENNLFWLAEIIDPFSFNNEINNQKIYSKLNFSVERKVLNKADLVCVMTARIQSKYVSLFPEINEKINVIHNLYVPVKDVFLDNNKKKESKAIKFVFMGTLSPGVRTPENLLKIFEKLLNFKSSINLELHLYGKINSSIKSFNEYADLINKSIFLHGSVPKNQVHYILKEADILVNIGNSNPYQEPSKIIEYVYLGKPVINICSINNDSSKELLDQYPLNFNIYKSDIENDNMIEKLIEFVTKNLSVERSHIDKIISPYLLEKVEKKYYNLFWK
ncbi:MAG TPA: hypothetical protein VFC65_03410 [Prolixibacteraceae bacterium]|nr:hypothetical protein [Prolixibacteraceae bacterium]